MAELPLEELLSAFLDGELSADEQARAEQLLLDDPQARRLLTEFRSVGGQLRNLPRQTLPPDFCQQVLRQAERRMLGQAPSPTSAPAGRQTVSVASALPEQTWSERIRRPLIYAMLAASVGFVLMALNPDQQPKTANVAMAPRGTSVAPATIEELEVASETSNSSRLAPAAPNISAPDAAASADAPSLSAATASPAATSPAAASQPDMRLGEALERDDAGVATSRIGGAAGAFGKGGAGLSPPLEAMADPRVELNGEGLLVVECSVAPAALKSEAFQRVLARQQVQWAYASVDDKEGQGIADSRLSGRARQTAAADDSGVKLLYVEATPEQMEKTLAELSAQPENFPSVAVDPFANTGRQLRWQNQYSRRSQLNDYYEQQSAQTGLPRVTESKADESAGAPQDKVAARKGGEPAQVASGKVPAVQKRPEPSAKPDDMAKQTSPPAGTLDNYRNNPSRARSYSVPREQKSSVAGAEPEAASQAPAAPVAQRPSPATQLRRDGADPGANRLRALFVLQLAEPPVAEADAIPADAAARQAPPARSTPATSSDQKR